MTLLELITALREDILDDTGGDAVIWQDSTKQDLLRWSNSALTRYINQAQNEVAIRTRCIRDASGTIAVKIGTSVYQLDDKALDIERVKLTGYNQKLHPVSWKTLDQQNSRWEDQTGTPEYYIPDWSTGYIKLYPEPIADDTISLIVDRLPKRDLRLAQWSSDKPEIPEEWQYKMLHWAAHLAYSKDEPNTIDPQKAVLHDQLFTREFGHSENLYTTERKKKPIRAVRYGGL